MKVGMIEGGMPMSITQRTLKTVLATYLSIYIATQLHLSYPMSAGIIAVLSVLDTRKASFRGAWQRIVSAIIALALASVLFTQWGYSLGVFGFCLLIYVPIVYRLNVQSGIGPSLVLVTHLFMDRIVNATSLLNEISLMLIGTGIGLLFNSYMPSQHKKIQDSQLLVEERMKEALLLIHRALISGARQEATQAVTELRPLLHHAKQLVYRERDNQVFRNTDYFIRYFDMRSSQVKLLKQMIQAMALCDLDLAESKIIAGLFYLAADQLNEHNSAIWLMSNIEEVRADIRQRQLPQTRAEFEKRAILFQMLNDFTRFIQLKVDFYTEYANELEEMVGD